MIYFDHAATTPKPKEVIDAIAGFYTNYNGSVDGYYETSVATTKLLDQGRQRVADFINAESKREIVFTAGTTDGINQLAQALGRQCVGVEGKNIVITEMEHHANMLPWSRLVEDMGWELRVLPVDVENLELTQDLSTYFDQDTVIFAVTHVSNTLGTINSIKSLIEESRGLSPDIVTVVDGAQAVAHIEVDVQELCCDYYHFSAHKMYGPLGVGVMYGKQARLEQLPALRVGGKMVSSVELESSDSLDNSSSNIVCRTTYQDIPLKHEAGTPNVAGVVGMVAGIEYIEANRSAVSNEHQLVTKLVSELSMIDRVRLFTHDKSSSIVSYSVDDFDLYDLGNLLAARDVAVRVGHHCTMPLMHKLGVDGTVRASFGATNTEQEVDELVKIIKEIL